MNLPFLQCLVCGPGISYVQRWMDSSPCRTFADYSRDRRRSWSTRFLLTKRSASLYLHKANLLRPTRKQECEH